MTKKERWLQEMRRKEALFKNSPPNEYCPYCGQRLRGVWEYHNLARWHPACNAAANHPIYRQWQKERKT